MTNLYLKAEYHHDENEEQTRGDDGNADEVPEHVSLPSGISWFQSSSHG